MHRKPTNANTRHVFCTLLLLFVLSLLSACEKPAEIENPKEYSKDGITFTHPGNWSVTEDVEEDGYRYVIVETPGDALFMTQVYEQDEALDLDSFSESYSDQIKTEVPVGSAGESSRSPIERRIDGELLTGIYERFDMRLMGISVPHIVEYYRIDSGGKAYFLVTFVADEDLELVTKGFDQILGSLKIEKREAPESEPEPEFEPSAEPTQSKRKLRHAPRPDREGRQQ